MSYNEEMARYILLVYNNQSLEMPWIMGRGQPIPAGLSYPPSMNYEIL